MDSRWDRRGGPLWGIARLLMSVGVKCIPYTSQKRGVFLGYNTLNPKVSKKMKKILFVAGCRHKDNGIPRKISWLKIDHIVFISEFLSKIALSTYPIKSFSVIHLVGGVPADPNMKPVMLKEKIEDTIHFMISAKWWKRPFKRLRQSIKLFNNYILKSYPDSKLHVLGNKIPNDIEKGHIKYYRKTFHRDSVPNIYRKSHLQLILTPFDTGPMTVNESLHYRVPFVCSANTAANEFNSLIDGICGEIVIIDPLIKNAKHCRKYKPFTNKKFYDKELNYNLIMEAVDKIITNYNKYISWKWTKIFNYETQAKKWLDVLFD